MLKIADLEFDLEKKEFNAYISVGENGYKLAWDIELISTPKVIETEYDTEWQPSILAHQFLNNLPALEKIANTEFVLADEVDDEPQFCLQVYDYEPIRDVTIHFGNWINGEIDFYLEGVANVYYDDKYDENLKIILKTLLKPDYVKVDTSKAEQADQLIQQFFPNIKFSENEFKEGLGFFYYFP